MSILNLEQASKAIFAALSSSFWASFIGNKLRSSLLDSLPKSFLRPVLFLFLAAMLVPHKTFAAAADDKRSELAEGRVFDLRYLIDNAYVKKRISAGAIPFGEVNIDGEKRKVVFVFKRGRGAGLDIYPSTMADVGIGKFKVRPLIQLWNNSSISQQFFFVDDQEVLAEAGFPASVETVIYSNTPPDKDPTNDIRAFVKSGDFIFQMVVNADGAMTLRCPLCGDVSGSFCGNLELVNQVRYLCPDCRSGSAAKKLAADEVTTQRHSWKMGRITRKSTD